MNEAVLDASALLALLGAEPGADAVAACLPNAAICAVNLSEVIAKLAEAGMPEDAIHAALALPIRLVDFDEALAFRAGLMRPRTRSLGLSLGDRACLALAGQLEAKAVTAESLWSKLPPGASDRRHRAPSRARAGARTRLRRGAPLRA